MHIMVNKRYMRKYDTCIGYGAHINKLLLKKPPGIMSADSASSVCKQCTNEPLTASEKEKGQTQAQMGRSLHHRPSPDRRGIPSVKRIGQPTRAEPMERSPSPKILRLTPDSEYVSLPRPPFYIFYCLLSPSFFPLFFNTFYRLICALFAHT